jgi:hypothetical protein
MELRAQMKPWRRHTGEARVAIFLVALLWSGSGLYGQGAPDLAIRLSNATTQSAAIEEAVSGGKETERLLLQWTQKAPPDVDAAHLMLGMIAVFERLRSEVAIPFLIANISVGPHTALRTGPSFTNILNESPAVRALIAIGEPAVPPLIAAYVGPLNLEDRNLVLFTISQMKGVRVRRFLVGQKAFLAEEQNYITVGLKRIDAEGGTVRK